MRTILPTKSIGLLMAIGFLDLISTAWLHARGEIVEVNPLMRLFIEHSEWTFAVVKATTLIVAWVVMARYARQNLEFVRRACAYGSISYLAVWTIWFTAAG